MSAASKAQGGAWSVTGGASAAQGERRSVVLGTAGHIDHGKTALVLALTGTDTDRLPEEKARGITIDLGFAALELVGPAGQRFEASLIDVPGHHAFVRNMLAGAGGIDAVMLVVAADEGVKAQTVEHLQICRLLGIPRGLVVLTKRDAVNEDRLDEARAEVEDLVRGTFLEGAPVLAVSALQREGIGELKAALGRLAAEIPARSAAQVPRLPVDRVFTVRGFGTVVTGTLQAGRVRAGESWKQAPQGRVVRVRGVQVHGKARAEAVAPNRVALNLAAVEVAEVHRGDTLVPENTLEPVQVADVAIETLEGAPPLRHRQRVRVHAFASDCLATVLLYDADGSSTSSQVARLRLERPMVLVPGDRLVLRQPSPARTLAGAGVLDAYPLPRLRKVVTAAWLQKLRGADAAQAVALRVERRGTAGVSLSELVRETGATREALRHGLAPLLAGGRVIANSGQELLLSAEAVAAVERRVLDALAKATGGTVAKVDLRARASVTDPVFELVLGRLLGARRLESRGELVALPGKPNQPTGATALSGRASQVEALYRAAGLAAPIASEAAQQLRIDAGELRNVLTALLRAGRLTRMGSDALLVHAEALAKLTDDLRQQRGRSFDVAWFKQFTGLTRKHAIPLLEYLDGARVTRNVGGSRTVV